MKSEEHDELWDLLGKARQPVVSPFFSRNVLREIRGQEQERAGSWMSFLFRWQGLAASVCLGAIAAAGWVSTQEQQQPHEDEQQQLLAMAERVYTSPDYGVINNLDELLDSEKNAAWLGGDIN